MTKQRFQELFKMHTKGRSIPEVERQEYYELLQVEGPALEEYKPVATGRAISPLQSGLLNEISAPGGVKYISGYNK